MSQYILENDKEALRLEKMSKISAYQPSKEVVKLSLKPGQKILDAGCGSGLVARYIANAYRGVKVEACDLSAVRIEQARKIRQHEGHEDIRFFVTPLESIAADDKTYDCITCRYVFEFLPDPMKVLSEFRRVLKPDGQLLIIQFDGFLYNYFQGNSELSEMLELLQKKGPFDMFLGRKIPNMLMNAGFTDIDWDVEVYGFKGKELLLEKEQMWERIDFSIPALAPVLGSHEKAVLFRDLYAREMTAPGSVLFYNKFLIKGVKPR